MAEHSLEDWAPRAVTDFRSELALAGGSTPHRLEARIEGRDGMSVLCAIEPILGGVVRAGGGALELVWLKSADHEADRLVLRAWTLDGALVMDRVYRGVAGRDA